MKKNMVLAVFFAALIVGAGIASANPGIQGEFSVPFAFYADNTLLPAGNYNVEMGAIGMGAVASSVVIRANDGTRVKVLITQVDSDASTSSHRLIFHQYGDAYFLSSVSLRNYKANLQPTKIEQELRSQIDKAESTTQMAKM